MNAHRNLTVKPQVERLEDRCLPTTASLVNGVLNVIGTDAGETIRITQASGRISVAGVGSVSIATVRGIMVDARAGNDTIEMRTVTVPATVYAGWGDDFVVGTSAGDYLDGGDGNDRIFGMNGNDSLVGGTDNDVLFGMNGYDYLYGQDGNDFLDDGSRSGQEYADGGYGTDYNADVVAVSGFTMTDVKQEGAPTCGFLSALSGLAKNGTDFTRWIRYAGFTSGGVPQYDVAFWRASGWTWTRVNFNGALTGKDTNPVAEGESWVVLMQRAWIKFHGNGGQTWPHQAVYALVGKTAAVKYSVADADYARIANALQSNKLVLTATKAAPQAKLVGGHAYTVTAVWGTGSNLWVQVRNPWGYDGGREAYGDASDALVWVTWSEFKANMNYLAIA